MRFARKGKIENKNDGRNFLPFLEKKKSSLHSLCLNQELDVCLFLALGYFLIGMGGEARHRGANISLSTSQ